jgi:hypothetical protein
MYLMNIHGIYNIYSQNKIILYFSYILFSEFFYLIMYSLAQCKPHYHKCHVTCIS